MIKTVENGAASKAAASVRGGRLADRLEANAKALMEFATSLSADEWRKVMPGDGRTFGVLAEKRRKSAGLSRSGATGYSARICRLGRPSRFCQVNTVSSASLGAVAWGPCG